MGGVLSASDIGQGQMAKPRHPAKSGFTGVTPL
jgi:hypothetical protein